jgi:hypothetical protein
VMRCSNTLEIFQWFQSSSFSTLSCPISTRYLRSSYRATTFETVVRFCSRRTLVRLRGTRI